MFVHVSEPKGCWDVLWTPSLIFFPCWFQNCQHEEGDIRVYSIAVWNLFQAVFRYFNLICGIAVSSSPTVCSFSTFWLVVFCKRRSFKIFWYWLVAFSCPIKVNTICNKNTVRFKHNGKWLHNFWNLILELLLHPMTRLFDHCTDEF